VDGGDVLVEFIKGGEPFGASTVVERVPQRHAMAHIETHVFRGVKAPQSERAFQSSVDAQRSDDVVHFSDDDYYSLPTAHPGRELFTMSLFVLLTTGLVIWGGWKLISLVISLI
jgi:hypothetical protein